MAEAQHTGPRLRDRLNLVWTLLWRNFLPRNRRESFQLVWVFAEPIGQLAVMILIFTLIGRAPGYGNSFALFLLTGIGMLTLFTRGAQLVASAIQGLAGSTRLAAIGMFHESLAKVLFEVIVALTFFTVLAWGIGMVQHMRTAPHHPLVAAEAFFWGGLFAFGFGLLRGWAMLFLPPLDRLYTILSRVLIFVSGVFFVPSFMPDPYRSWLSWNPVVHLVELLRLGVYDQYPSIVYAPDYLRAWALGATAFGMALLWRARARVMG
jgi:capsular polysaccharide transport system permease protein